MNRSHCWAEPRAVIAYLRSRRLHRLACIAAVIALATTAVRSAAVFLPLARAGVEFTVPVTALAPALIAAILGSGLHSPTQELDRTAQRSMWRTRLATIALILLVGGLLAASPALAAGDSTQAAAAIRNYIGFLGLTLVTGAVIGYGLSWITPLAFFGLTVIYGVEPGNQPAGWAWFITPADAPQSWIVSLGLMAAGAVAATYRAHEPATQRST